jgi:hypothetical protein
MLVAINPYLHTSEFESSMSDERWGVHYTVTPKFDLSEIREHQPVVFIFVVRFGSN